MDHWMNSWRSDSARYLRVVSWRVVEVRKPLGDYLRILATQPDGSERAVQGTFRTREQLDRYVERFLPHLKDKETPPQPQAPRPVPANEDQQGFLEFIGGVTSKQLRNTYQSFCLLAAVGQAEDIWKRDACYAELLRRGLPIPEAREADGESYGLATDPA
jgi:hypothetical protein